MNVRRLLAHLGRRDPNTEVVIFDPNCGETFEITGVGTAGSEDDEDFVGCEKGTLVLYMED